MPQYLIDLVFAMFAWWFGTGVVLYLNQLPERTHRWSLSAATLIMLAALHGLAQSAQDASSRGALLAFTQALLVWAWMEMSYFTGALTGPDSSPCPADVSGWRRFRLALRTSLYHETAVAAAGLLIIALTVDAPNPVGCWTYTTLWLMRWSAKLNLFLGVANVHDEWFPRRLAYLSTYIRRQPMNLLFPLSVCAGTVAATWMFGAAETDDSFRMTAHVLVGTLLALGTLEHWFLVLPLRDSLLWQWALKAARRGRLPDPEGPDKALCLDVGQRDQERAARVERVITAG
jgi:putative photosynthetic complex assembly protein 2